MSHEADTRIPPDLQGRLQVVQILSQGNGGEVLLCHDRRLGRRVVLKLALLHEEQDEDLARRFIREAKVLSKLEHRQVLRILDAGETGRSRYLLFEYLEGKDFQQLLDERGALSWREALECTRAVADGLAAVHASDVLHRDIKPANVMMHETRGPVLIDFGISQRTVDSTAITRSGSLVGTPEFLAPERITSGRTTPASDVYSVGVFLHTLISGRSPFLRTDLISTLEAQVNDPAPELPGLPGPVQQLLQKMLSKVDADRPRDGKALLEQIDGVLEGLEPPPVEESRPAAEWQKARRLGAAVPEEPEPAPLSFRLPAAIAIAGGLAIAGFLVGRRAPAPPVPIVSPTVEATPAIRSGTSSGVTSITKDPVAELEVLLSSRKHHGALSQLLVDSPLTPDTQGFLGDLEDWIDRHEEVLRAGIGSGDGPPGEVGTALYEKLHPVENVTHLLPESSVLRQKVHRLRSRHVSVQTSTLTTDPEPGLERVWFPPEGGREIYLAPYGVSKATCVEALRRVMSSEPHVEEALRVTLDLPGLRDWQWVDLTVTTRCLSRGLYLVLDLGGTRRVDIFGIGPPLSLDLFARLDVVLSDGGRASPWQVHRCRLPGRWLIDSGGRIQMKLYTSLARPGAAMTFVPSVYLVTTR